MSIAVSMAPRRTARQGTLARLRVRKVRPNHTAKMPKVASEFRVRTT